MRGAQVPPDQPDLATSPDVQETDERVFGATVSLDELTVQPDLSDASELSDEDNGSDPPDQSTLPQRSEQKLCLVIKVTWEAAGNFELYRNYM